MSVLLVALDDEILLTEEVVLVQSVGLKFCLPHFQLVGLAQEAQNFPLVLAGRLFREQLLHLGNFLLGICQPLLQVSLN